VTIVDFPEITYVNETTLLVEWETNHAADSEVFYGIEKPTERVSLKEKTTSHALTVKDVKPGAVYELEIRSAGAAYSTAVAIPENMAIFLDPQRDWANGDIELRAGPAVAGLNVTQAEFLYRTAEAGEWISIRLDKEGQDEVANCFQSEDGPTGDGWATIWKTKKLSEGHYEVLVRLTSRIGLLEAKRKVYIDPTPPTALLKTPVFGQDVKGTVSILADPSDGTVAVFQTRKGTVTNPYKVKGLKQTDYPYDRARGKMMCDPTSEAAILWEIPEVRAKFRGKNVLKKLVWKLAKLKGTNRGGTTRSNEQRGCKSFLKTIGPLWGCELVGTEAGALKFPIFKKKVEGKPQNPRLEYKGVTVHVKKRGKPKDPGHVIAVVSITNKKGGGGKLRLMDPLTGTEFDVDVAKDGTFTHPTLGAVQLQWANLIVGPVNTPGSSGSGNGSRGSLLFAKAGSAPNVAALYGEAGNDARRSGSGRNAAHTTAEWTTISTDDTGSDGWQAQWDTTGLEPGPHWVRITFTDARGHTDSDMVEVWID